MNIKCSLPNLSNHISITEFIKSVEEMLKSGNPNAQNLFDLSKKSVQIENKSEESLVWKLKESLIKSASTTVSNDIKKSRLMELALADEKYIHFNADSYLAQGFMRTGSMNDISIFAEKYLFINEYPTSEQIRYLVSSFGNQNNKDLVSKLIYEELHKKISRIMDIINSKNEILDKYIYAHQLSFLNGFIENWCMSGTNLTNQSIFSPNDIVELRAIFDAVKPTIMATEKTGEIMVKDLKNIEMSLHRFFEHTLQTDKIDKEKILELKNSTKELFKLVERDGGMKIKDLVDMFYIREYIK